MVEHARLQVARTAAANLPTEYAEPFTAMPSISARSPTIHRNLPNILLPPANTIWLNSSNPYLRSRMKCAQSNLIARLRAISGLRCTRTRRLQKPGHRQPERQRHHTMQHEREGAVEMDLAKRVADGSDRQHAVEVVA